jgi:hypothetical protein
MTTMGGRIELEYPWIYHKNTAWGVVQWVEATWKLNKRVGLENAERHSITYGVGRGHWRGSVEGYIVIDEDSPGIDLRLVIQHSRGSGQIELHTPNIVRIDWAREALTQLRGIPYCNARWWDQYRELHRQRTAATATLDPPIETPEPLDQPIETPEPLRRALRNIKFRNK